MADDDNKQPAWKPGRPAGVPHFNAGSSRSVGRLKYLNFDPIGELVDNYRKLQYEIERQEKIRDGAIVELSSTGKPKAYRAEVHHALYDKMIAIGDKLLRYGYGRVPETTIIEEKRPMPLVVNLTKKGDQYIVNDEQLITDDGEYDDN
jgi:hypothetical protein